jgi:hypothetical protein
MRSIFQRINHRSLSQWFHRPLRLPFQRDVRRTRTLRRGDPWLSVVAGHPPRMAPFPLALERALGLRRQRRAVRASGPLDPVLSLSPPPGRYPECRLRLRLLCPARRSGRLFSQRANSGMAGGRDYVRNEARPRLRSSRGSRPRARRYDRMACGGCTRARPLPRIHEQEVAEARVRRSKIRCARLSESRCARR